MNTALRQDADTIIASSLKAVMPTQPSAVHWNLKLSAHREVGPS